MRPYFQAIALTSTWLLRHAVAQSCIISQIESNGVGIPVGCLATASGNPAGTGADSQTVVSTGGVAVTIPTGISTLTTITRSGSNVRTYTPSTMPSGASMQSTAEETIITSGGTTLTSILSGEPEITTGTSAQETTITIDGTTFVTTLSNEPEVTTTISAHETVISDEADVITVPTGLTASTVFTESGSRQVTWFPPEAQTTQSDNPEASTSPDAAVLIPVTTPVENPKPEDTGSVIPCKNWFFSLCITWDDIVIGGWRINVPPGTIGPGPPPPFTSGPHFSISVTDPLPPWPKYTIGPDHTPTFPSDPGDEGCKTATARYCATTTSFGVSTSGGVTSTTKTSVLSTCGTLAGCDATGTSTAAATTSTCAPSDNSCPTASSYPYVVYPEDGRNVQSVKALAERLKFYTPDPSKILTSDTKDLGVNYWQLPLNESVVEQVRQLPDVGVLGAQCDPSCANDNQCITCYDPTISAQYQELDQEPRSLPFISWPPNRDAPLSDRRYYFDDTNGEGVTVYILDTGANLDHPEFSNSKLLSKYHNVRWIHVNTDLDGRTPDDDSYTPLDPSKVSRRPSHGTAMLSLVAGNTLGVAKKANVVIVRLPRRVADTGGFTKEDFLDGLSRIEEDIVPSPDQGVSSVVLLAHAYDRDAFLRRRPSGGQLKDENNQPIYDDVRQGSWIFRVKLMLQNIASKGGLVVTGAGNVGGEPLRWPARYAGKREDEPLDTILVVGAVSNDGQSSIYPQVDPAQFGIPHVFAPGDSLRIADGQPTKIAANEPYRDDGRGTSEASAFTAGLAAYYLSLAKAKRLPAGDGFSNTVVDFKNYIIKKSWSRAKINGQDFLGISNGLTWEEEQQACAWNPNEATRRLRNRADSCPAPTTTPSSQPSPAHSSPSTSVVSTAAPTPAISTTPLTEQPVVCNNEKDFPEHGDIKASSQKQFAKQFCNLAVQTSPGHPKIAPPDVKYDDAGPTAHGFNYTTTDNKGVSYSYLIQWVEGCVTTVPEMDIMTPVPDPSAYDCIGLLANNYEACANGGVGGSSQAGCVKYTFVGGLGAPPPCDGCIGVHTSTDGGQAK